MAKTMLEVRELTTKYITRFHEDVYAVDHVSLKIEEGKSLGIAGESGCGKSTLALSLMGYYFPPLHYTSGDIIIDGKHKAGNSGNPCQHLTALSLYLLIHFRSDFQKWILGTSPPDILVFISKIIISEVKRVYCLNGHFKCLLNFCF